MCDLYEESLAAYGKSGCVSEQTSGVHICTHYIRVDRPSGRGRCNRALHHLRFEEMQHLGVVSEAERTSDVIYVHIHVDDRNCLELYV